MKEKKYTEIKTYWTTNKIDLPKPEFTKIKTQLKINCKRNILPVRVNVYSVCWCFLQWVKIQIGKPISKKLDLR